MSQKNVMRKQRPLSPHIQIYKWQLTSVLSIFHRMTGIFLCSLALLMVVWLLSLRDVQTYEALRALLHHPIGKLYGVVLAFCLFYHLLNGVRHLLWDAGFGLDLKTTYRSGWTVLLMTTVSTIFYIFLLYAPE